MKRLIVDGEPTVLQLWDTAGQERLVWFYCFWECTANKFMYCSFKITDHIHFECLLGLLGLFYLASGAAGKPSRRNVCATITSTQSDVIAVQCSSHSGELYGARVLHPTVLRNDVTSGEHHHSAEVAHDSPCLGCRMRWGHTFPQRASLLVGEESCMKVDNFLPPGTWQP